MCTRAVCARGGCFASLGLCPWSERGEQVTPVRLRGGDKQGRWVGSPLTPRCIGSGTGVGVVGCPTLCSRADREASPQTAEPAGTQASGTHVRSGEGIHSGVQMHPLDGRVAWRAPCHVPSVSLSAGGQTESLALPCDLGQVQTSSGLSLLFCEVGPSGPPPGMTRGQAGWARAVGTCTAAPRCVPGPRRTTELVSVTSAHFGQQEEQQTPVSV